MDWLTAVPWLIAYAFGIVVMGAIVAWVTFVMVEVARTARRLEVASQVMDEVRTLRAATWRTGREGLARGRDLARHFPPGGSKSGWPRGAVGHRRGAGPAHVAAGPGPRSGRGPASPVLYVEPEHARFLSAWVVHVHADGSRDLEWLDPFEGRMVQVRNVRPEHDRVESAGYWKEHPASTVTSGRDHFQGRRLPRRRGRPRVGRSRRGHVSPATRHERVEHPRIPDVP